MLISSERRPTLVSRFCISKFIECKNSEKLKENTALYTYCIRLKNFRIDRDTDCTYLTMQKKLIRHDVIIIEFK